jgi:hypothetical protein
MNDQISPLLDLKAAVVYLGLSPRALLDLCRPDDPKITFTRIDRYNWRFRKEDLDAFLAARTYRARGGVRLEEARDVKPKPECSSGKVKHPLYPIHRLSYFIVLDRLFLWRFPRRHHLDRVPSEQCVQPFVLFPHARDRILDRKLHTIQLAFDLITVLLELLGLLLGLPLGLPLGNEADLVLDVFGGDAFPPTGLIILHVAVHRSQGPFGSHRLDLLTHRDIRIRRELHANPVEILWGGQRGASSDAETLR